MHSIAARLIALVCCAWMALGGCDRKPGPPPAPPAITPAPTPAPTGPRIVTLSPALGVIVRDLGLADRTVGRDGYDMVLPRSLPVCGRLGEIDYETLARVNPTVILLQWGKLDRPKRLDEMAAAGGWQVRDSQILALDDIPVATRELAALLGARARGEDLVRQMAASWSKREGLERAGRVLLLESISPPAALGPGSWHADLLVRLGGTPAVTEGKPFVRMDAEDVLRLDPDGIIFFNPRDPDATGPDVVLGPEALEHFGRLAGLNIAAARNGRLAVITDPLALTPSTAMIGVADQIATILAQWAADAGRSR